MSGPTSGGDKTVTKGAGNLHSGSVLMSYGLTVRFSGLKSRVNSCYVWSFGSYYRKSYVFLSCNLLCHLSLALLAIHFLFPLVLLMFCSSRY